MIQCVMNQDTLHQYNAIIPYGCTIESCLNDDALYEKLLAEPVVMVLGRFGELMSLNLMAAYMTEQIIAGKTSEEIMKAMFLKYARSVEMAERIALDFFDLIRRLDEMGYAKIVR